MKRYLYLVMALSALVITACSSDDDTPLNEDSPAGYYFELTITDTGRDQADLILTTIEYTDYKGNDVTDTFNDQGEGSYTLVSHEYTKIPATGTIEVTQKLRSGLTYDKSSYVLGQTLSLRVTSTNMSGSTISSRLTESETSMTVRADNLGKAYPVSTKFTYIISKDGTVQLK